MGRARHMHHMRMGHPTYYYMPPCAPAARGARASQLRAPAVRMKAQCYGGRSGGVFAWYFDIPSPNTTVFSVLWPPSIALWGSLVPPYTLVVRLKAPICT
jgi:hypothetical protein